MLISDIIFKVLLHKEESLMRICAKSLYPAPLLDIEITAKQVLEEIQAVLILVKIIDSAQEKYKAIPNEQYSPAIIRNIKEGMISIKCKGICIWFKWNVLIKLTQRGTLKLGSAFFI